MRFAVAGILVSVLFGAGAVSAQDHETGRIFLDATAFAAAEQRSHDEQQSPVLTSNDLSHVVPGEGLGVGTFLTPRVSLRVEASFPWGVETRSASSLPSGGITPSAMSEREYGNGSVAVMLGYHADSWGRVQFSYMGGPAFIRERSHFTQTIFNPGLPPLVPARTDRTEATSIDYRPAVALGVDLEIPLPVHLSLLPQLRVVAFTGEVSLRPGLALRWTP